MQYGLIMKHIDVPLQPDTTRYEKIVNENFREDTIIRWYIANIVNQTAKIEVVIEPTGVGMSKSDSMKFNIQ